MQERDSLFNKLRRTTVAAGLAVLFLLEVSAQAQTSGQMRPFKHKAIMTELVTNPDGVSGSYEDVGQATHCGAFIGEGTWVIVGASPDGSVVQLEVEGTITAANGDTIGIRSTSFEIDYTFDPPVGVASFEFLPGTGRFETATGWEDTVILYYETPVLSGEGEMNY